MEIFGNTMETFQTSKSLNSCVNAIASYAKGGIDLHSSYTTRDKTYISNLIFEKYSFRNGNFITIYMNLVQEKNTTLVFFTVKERQEGLINFSLGKKQKITNEIKALLIS